MLISSKTHEKTILDPPIEKVTESYNISVTDNMYRFNILVSLLSGNMLKKDIESAKETYKAILSESGKTEVWVPIYGFPEHSISSYGNIKRLTSSKIKEAGEFITTRKSGKNIVATITNHIVLNTYITIRFSVPELVLACFGYARPSKQHVVGFIDGNPNNIKLYNLKWTAGEELIKLKKAYRKQPKLKYKNSFAQVVELLRAIFTELDNKESNKLSSCVFTYAMLDRITNRNIGYYNLRKICEELENNRIIINAKTSSELKDINQDLFSSKAIYYAISPEFSSEEEVWEEVCGRNYERLAPFGFNPNYEDKTKKGYRIPQNLALTRMGRPSYTPADNHLLKFRTDQQKRRKFLAEEIDINNEEFLSEEVETTVKALDNDIPTLEHIIEYNANIREELDEE